MTHISVTVSAKFRYTSKDVRVSPQRGTSGEYDMPMDNIIHISTIVYAY